MNRLLRDPLLHFLLIGVVLFAGYHFLGGASKAGPQSRDIRLSLDELAQLTTVFQSQWQRPPTVGELSRLVEDRVREEVLYREALAMGLDQDDTIIKRRLAQKMQFLAEDVAASREPTPDELQAWFDKHRASFREPGRLGFRHLYFSPDRRGKRAREDAEKALVSLQGEPEDSPRAESIADAFMFQNYYRDRAPDFLGKEFGPGFALELQKLKPGSWQGPIASGYGWHLVFVDTVIPGREPELEEIEADVRTAWLNEQKALAWDRAYRAMRDRYTVYLPGPPGEQAPR
jgi:peptidyl-prolyl cis-trans isomerase C